MRFHKFGGAALAAVFLATMAPVALAQQPAAVAVSKQMVQPMNEASAAIVAKDWPTAKAKLDQAAALVKLPPERLAVEKLRVSYAANSGDSATLVTAVDAIIATNLMTPAELKPYKAALPDAYSKLGDAAKALAASKAFLEEYGGTHDQYAAMSRDASKANDYATTITYANKAIDAAIAAKIKPPESYYKLLALGYQQSKDMDKYYAARERALADYPSETTWKELIARVQTMPGYGGEARLDMFRTLQGANVKLAAGEKRTAATEALKRGMPNETLQLLEPAFASGELGSDPDDKKTLGDAKTAAADDKANLAKETAGVLTKGDGAAIAKIGEAHLSYGDNAKAIEVIQKGLDKGIPDAAEADAAKLHLGIAQYRAGQKDAARTTWGTVTPGGVYGVLAHNWVLISNIVP